MANDRKGRNNAVHSVHRAISILQILARRGPSGVTEIAEDLSVHKSTVFRLLATLESRGIVEQSAARGQYQLGYGVVELAAGATKQRDLAMISRPICQELALTVSETVNVAVKEGDAAVSIDQVIGSSSLTIINWVGQRSPLHATSAGKVFLAHLSEVELKAFLSEPLERYTEHTTVDPGALEQQLATVREQGFAATFEEHEVGLAAIAAPIRGLGGDVVAAVTISGPRFRFEATIPDLADHVLAAAADISERNGYPHSG